MLKLLYSLPQPLTMTRNCISLATILTVTFSAFLAEAQTTYTFKPVTKFDYPGAPVTTALGIDDSNNVVGYYIPEGEDYANGFERYADGSFSAPIIAPGDKVFQTQAAAINNAGIVAGYYDVDFGGGRHGFFLKDGVYTTFDYPGAVGTEIHGINDAGDFVGTYTNPDFTYGAFASVGGNLVAITIPDSTYISPSDINNDGEIIGWYNTPTNSVGFLIEGDGTYHYPLNARGSSAVLYGTNDKRYSVGETYDGTTLHGLFYAAPHTFVTYDFAATSTIQLTGINNAGYMCGAGPDIHNNSLAHSFIVRVRSEPGAVSEK